MGTAQLLWFFLWRTSLWGAGLCGLSAAICGAGLLVLGIAVSLLFAGGPVGEGSAAAGLVYVVAFGVVYGALGAVTGTFLGLLCGPLLFVLTRAFFRPRFVATARYPSAAGWVCAATAVLVPLIDWFVDGYPDMEDFGLERFVGDTNANPEPSPLTILVYVILPMPVLALPMWLTGKLVSGRCQRQVREATDALEEGPEGFYKIRLED